MFKKFLLVTAMFASISYAVFATNVGRAFSIGGLRFPGSTAVPRQDVSPEPDKSEGARYNSRSDSVISEGRIASYPGATVSVGAEITGTLIEVCVFENEMVRKGQLIARMRSDDLRASRDLSAAELAEATAEGDYWTREVARLENLYKRNASAFADLDSGRRSMTVMVARKARAKAALEQAEALLAKTQIFAPINGMVVARSAHPGETLTVGTVIVKLVDLSRIRVEAEVDEYDVSKIALKTACTITAEGFLGKSWSGTVEEIPAEVTPRRIRPEDPSRPADTRVVVVKVTLNEPTTLKLGQRVYLTIRHGHTESSSAGSVEATNPGSEPRTPSTSTNPGPATL